jgi:hypothetical protein
MRLPASALFLLAFGVASGQAVLKPVWSIPFLVTGRTRTVADGDAIYIARAATSTNQSRKGLGAPGMRLTLPSCSSGLPGLVRAGGEHHEERDRLSVFEVLALQ